MLKLYPRLFRSKMPFHSFLFRVSVITPWLQQAPECLQILDSPFRKALKADSPCVFRFRRH